MQKTIEIAAGSMTLRPDGILHVVIDFAESPTKEAAEEFIAVRSELIGTEPPPVVIEIIRLPYTERTVRSFLMDTMKPPPCRAVVVTDPTLRTLFRTYEVVSPTPVPSEVFATVEAAVEWIHAWTATD